MPIIQQFYAIYQDILKMSSMKTLHKLQKCQCITSWGKLRQSISLKKCMRSNISSFTFETISVLIQLLFACIIVFNFAFLESSELLSFLVALFVYFVCCHWKTSSIKTLDIKTLDVLINYKNDRASPVETNWDNQYLLSNMKKSWST